MKEQINGDYNLLLHIDDPRAEEPVVKNLGSFQINFNEGATVWIGSNAEPCQLASIGDAGHVTRLDPVVATRNDVWDLTLTGQAGLVNNVFSTVTLHGVKIYNAGGAI